MTDDEREHVRLALDRIQRICLTAALCMVCWLAVAMVLLWLVGRMFR